MKTKKKVTFSQLKDALINFAYEVVLTDGRKLNHLAKEGGYQTRTTPITIKGYIVPEEYKIYVNRTLGLNDRVITLIHELIHELRPDWDEERVESESQDLFLNLKVDELGFLQFFVMTDKDPENFVEDPRK